MGRRDACPTTVQCCYHSLATRSMSCCLLGMHLEFQAGDGSMLWLEWDRRDAHPTEGPAEHGQARRLPHHSPVLLPLTRYSLHVLLPTRDASGIPGGGWQHAVAGVGQARRPSHRRTSAAWAGETPAPPQSSVATTHSLLAPCPAAYSGCIWNSRRGMAACCGWSGTGVPPVLDKHSRRKGRQTQLCALHHFSPIAQSPNRLVAQSPNRSTPPPSRSPGPAPPAQNPHPPRSGTSAA